ncbi:MAG: TrmJ/YjtD family RNA methyltransferase [Candidatus Thermoplasmatota archaeon]|nr:TrmJ/YjtD family RNA methyltransferase [Candidatus Thermoplasmatota archaeon]
MDWPAAHKLLSENFHIALVGPKYQGNIGAVARAMHNTGFEHLLLVNAPELTDEAYQRAVSSEYILKDARILPDFNSLRTEYGIVVGTSSVETISSRKFRRISIPPDEFWAGALERNEKMVIAFGREGDGLHNDELEKCDHFIHIPANPEYPVYNLSHAVSIFLYQGFLKLYESPPTEIEPISDTNLKRLVEGFSRILDDIHYPRYKRKNTDVMIRRMLARASLSQTEFFKMMGILRHTAEHLEGKE